MFQVGDQSRLTVKWLGFRPDLRSAGALPCHLNLHQDSDCYFGRGLYSDGICDEVKDDIVMFYCITNNTSSQELGVILPSEGRVFMQDPFKPDSVSQCSAYSVVIYK